MCSKKISAKMVFCMLVEIMSVMNHKVWCADDGSNEGQDRRFIPRSNHHSLSFYVDMCAVLDGSLLAQLQSLISVTSMEFRIACEGILSR